MQSRPRLGLRTRLEGETARPAHPRLWGNCVIGRAANNKFGGGGVAMRRLTLLASAVALGVIASGSAVSQSRSPPPGRDARRIGQQPQSEPKKQPRLDV